MDSQLITDLLCLGGLATLSTIFCSLWVLEREAHKKTKAFEQVAREHNSHLAERCESYRLRCATISADVDKMIQRDRENRQIIAELHAQLASKNTGRAEEPAQALMHTAHHPNTTKSERNARANNE